MVAELPPHCLGINHIFILEKGKNGQKRNPPWGPLYKIIRNKLLILRKILNERLDKGNIRTNNSLIRTSVLFIKKKDVFDFIWITRA